MENRNHVRLVSSTPVLLYVEGHGRVKGMLQDVSQGGVAVCISEQTGHLFAEGDEVFMLANNIDQAFPMKIVRIDCCTIGLIFIE